MNSKFHWGHGIMVFMGLFIIFISVFVYKTLFDNRYDHQLESKNYYNEELMYQVEVNRINNADALSENVQTQAKEDGLYIVFPSVFSPEKVKGIVELKRPDNNKLDYTTEIKLDSLTMIIPEDQLDKGVYNLKIIWNYDGKDYQKNEQIKFKMTE